MEIKINDHEINVLKKTLGSIVIKARTGEIGIIHGAERFVSTNNILKKDEISVLEKILSKIGLSGLRNVGK